MVSHNMNDIARLTDQVLVMDHGKLVMDGTPAEVFSRGEELRQIGLAVPEAMEIAEQIREAGLQINGTCLTLEDTADAIVRALKG